MARTAIILSVVAMLSALVPTAVLGEDGPAPTVIEELTVVDGQLSGTVDWGGQAPVVLGQDPTGDAPSDMDDHDLTSIAMWVEDGDDPTLTFAWRMVDLTGPPPPEVVRYYFQFSAGGRLMSLQAKTSDVVSAANAAGTPEGIASNVSSYGEHYSETGDLPQFRIRGNCETIVVVNSCGHVDWADGEFDAEADEIRFHVPLDHPDLPGLRPGALLSEDDNGAYSAIQAAADNTNTRDTVAQTARYTVPVRTATATITAPDGTTSTVPMTVGAEGAISLDGPIVLATGTSTVDVRACFAGGCDTATTTITV